MTEQLQHDPRTKQQIKDVLYKHLYEPIDRQFKARLQQIAIKNAAISGYTHVSFIYKNVVYNCDSTALPRKLNRLHEQLQPVMNEYLKEAKQLNEKELPYVIGFITQVLNASNELHDYLRLLPQSVHHPVQSLIDTCPCRGKKLSEETVDLLHKKNQIPIQLMKQRMVNNLLI
jgi:hypothetical protein